MVFYFGRRFHSAFVGTRLVTVVCDECGCVYHYELARVGSGTDVAPYAIGSGRAERSASDQAERDLQRRLTEEAELVPCPKCHWINDSLVLGYRRGRYRGWTKLARGLVLVGTPSSLVGAWFISLGPAADRGALPYFLIGGPLVSSGLAGFLLLLRFLLRSLIQPNRDYPVPPRVPRGSPVALVQNPLNGYMEPACTSKKSGRADQTWVEFQVGRSAFPPVCCACLAPAMPEATYRRPIRHAVEVAVPLCALCARRWSIRRWLGALAGGALTALVGLPILLALKLDEVVFWLTLCALGVIAPLIAAMVASFLAAPVIVKVVDAPRGVVRLWFRNEAFPEHSPAVHTAYF